MGHRSVNYEKSRAKSRTVISRTTVLAVVIVCPLASLFFVPSSSLLPPDLKRTVLTASFLCSGACLLFLSLIMREYRAVVRMTAVAYLAIGLLAVVNSWLGA